MAFTRPTLQDLIEQAEADLDARIPGADSRLRRSILSVLARVIAAAAYGLYGLLAWVYRQVFPDKAEDVNLERWASIWGLARTGALYAAGNVDVTGTNGTDIPEGSVLQRSDGAEFIVDTLTTISGGTASLPLTASEAGEAGNTAASTELTFLSPIEHVNETAVVDSSGLTGGADIETDAALRARLLERISAPPQGGNQNDFEIWAYEIAGVTRAWVTPPDEDSVMVTVHFVRDDESPITPDAGEIATMQAYLEERRPLGSRVVAVAPTLVPLDITVNNLSPDTPAVRAAVEAEHADMILRDAEPGGTILISRIREAVSIASGESDHEITDPPANVTHSAGELATPGTVTYTP